MPDPAPRFDQVNLVSPDLDATLAFYRRLGLAIPDEPLVWPPGSGAVHVGVPAAGGGMVEFDNAAMAALWHAGYRDGPARPATVLGFGVASRAAVDERYAALLAAGDPGRQPPYDAFWGARYAVVQDPDGRDVGLMSPIDADRTYVPEP
jgi:catechol 2,3-dioxygenase-like lactoylglutathione lyase family enzyme